MKKCSLFLLLAALFSGCILSKDEYDPTFSFPSKYAGEKNLPDVDQPMEGVLSFWNQFQDPVLTHLIEIIIDNNFDIRVALEKINEVRSLYRIEVGKLLPQIDYGVSWLRSRRSDNLFAEQFQGPLYQNLYTIGFDAAWEIDLFGKRWFNKKAAWYDFLASVESARFVYITTASELAKYYIDVRALQERIALFEIYIAEQKKTIGLNKDKFSAGLIAQFDVKQREAEMQAREAQLPLLKALLQQSIYAISNLLGQEPSALMELLSKPEPLPIAEGRVPLGMPSTLLKRRPDVRKAEQELLASKARIRVAKAELFPTFSLTAAYAYQSVMLSNWFTAPSRTWNISPSLLGPLFHGGQLRANVQARNSKQKQAAMTYEKTVLTAFKEVEDALLGYFQESRRVESLQDQLASVSRIQELSDSRYRAGLENYSFVIDADLQLFETKDKVIQSKQDLMIELIALYKAVGGGWECSDTP